MSKGFYSSGAGSSRQQQIDEFDEVYGPPSVVITDKEIDDRIMYNVPTEYDAHDAASKVLEDVELLIKTFSLIHTITPEVEHAYTKSVNLIYKYIVIANIPAIYEMYEPIRGKILRERLVIYLDRLKDLFETKPGFSRETVNMYHDYLDSCIRELISSRENWSSRMDMSKRKKKKGVKGGKKRSRR